MRLTAALAFTLTILLLSGPVQAQKIIVGVNVVGVDQASDKTVDELLQQLHDAGVTTIRTSLGGRGDRYTDFVIKAYQHGIGSVIFLGPTAGSTKNAHALPPDASAGRPWGVSALSDADPEAFQTWFTGKLTKLEAAGVHATAFELGNELNTPRFNADFGPDKVPGRPLGLSDLQNPNDSLGAAVASGYREYLKVMAAMKDVLDHSKLNRTTPVLSGMSAVMANGREWVKIPDSIEYLRLNGLDKLADGYAVHTYPDGHAQLPVAARVQALEQSGVLSACQKSTKPCWVTEWGFPNTSTACPLDDAGRASAVQAQRAAFKQFAQQGRLAAILYYSWSGVLPYSWDPPGKNNNDPYNIFRCGALTSAGHEAVAPF
jgi:hypothetical protein